VTAQIEAEAWASNALAPALTFSLARKATVPLTPVAYRASLLLSAGALLGCVAGVVAVQAGKGGYRTPGRTFPVAVNARKRSHEK
jgi:hypothetical protein